MCTRLIMAVSDDAWLAAHALQDVVGQHGVQQVLRERYLAAQRLRVCHLQSKRHHMKEVQ